MARQADMVCLRPGCGTPARTRGLCANDYAAAAYLVERGRVTWDVLMAAGKALPTKKGRPYGPAMDWLMGTDGQ